MKRIAVLGSTGSIGTQTLEIVRTNKDIKITALAAGNNIELLEKQIREFKPSIAAVWNEEKAAELKIKTADLDVEILSGMDGLLAAASWKDSQIVVTAIVGMIGILPTIEAIKEAKAIAAADGIEAHVQRARVRDRGDEGARCMQQIFRRQILCFRILD